MTDVKTETKTKPYPFLTLRYFLEGGKDHRRVSIESLVAAIRDKKVGIYGKDQFGHMVKANAVGENEAINALSLCHDSDNEPYYPGDHIIESSNGNPMDPYSDYGWYSNNPPKFKNLSELDQLENINHLSAQQKAAITKEDATVLAILGAALKKAGIDFNSPGAAKKIEGLMEGNRIRRDEGTILKVLKRVQSVYMTERND